MFVKHPQHDTMDNCGVQRICRNSAEEERLKAEFVKYLVLNIQNFQRTIILSRRRRQQSYRSRRNRLCQFYVRNLLELENRVLEMVSIIAANDILTNEELENNHNEETENEENPPEIPSKSKIPRNLRETMRFYEDVVSTYSEEKWLETFRMSQRTFQSLCTQLRDAMQPHGINSPLKNLISLEKRCALALYAFSTGADYREIAALFRISRTSVCKFMKRFAEAILEKLSKFLLQMPKTTEEYNEIRKNFQEISNVPPLCVGLLGVCEIHVSPHMDEMKSYVNNAGVTTLVLQAIVDDQLLFRKVNLESKIPNMLQEIPNEVTMNGVHLINDYHMPCFVIAPANYSTLRPWRLQPYTNPQEPHEHTFNNACEKLQAIKEEAFRRLYGRWKILQRKGDLEPRTMVSIATACCILHNLLEDNDEGYLDHWSKGVHLPRFDILANCESTNEPTHAIEAAMQIRNFLACTMHAELNGSHQSSVHLSTQ